MLKGISPWDIIIKNLETDEEISLSNKHKQLCPVCFYPIEKDVNKECHAGIEHVTSKISFLTGHFYETDYKSVPLNWYSKILKNISDFPFKYSHKLLSLVLVDKIQDSNWKLDSIAFSTMAPTTNQQMENVFSEITEKLSLTWIPSNEIFIRKELRDHIDDRREYVKNKYFLMEDISQKLLKFDKNKSILIFDDIFHQGFTLARITELLQSLSFRDFKLVTIARTLPKTFLKTFYFP